MTTVHLPEWEPYNTESPKDVLNLTGFDSCMEFNFMTTVKVNVYQFLLHVQFIVT